MQRSTLGELEKLFLALSDKTRLRLLALMADGEVAVGLLADSLGESQPKISRHLAYLRSAGLVSTRRDGKWIYYGLESQTDASAARILDAVLRSMLADGSVRNVRPQIVADEYVPYGAKVYTSSESHTDDWAPAEIEIFLL